MSVTHIFLRKRHVWRFLFVKRFAFATQQIIFAYFCKSRCLFLKTKRHPHLQRKAFEKPFLPSHTDIQDCPITRKTNDIETLSSLIHSGESGRQCLPLGLESKENQKQLCGSSPVQATGRPQLCLKGNKTPWFSEKESKKNNSDM